MSVCTVEDSVWRQDSEETERIGKDYCAVFPVVSYAVASVPSFPDGSIGFFLVSKSKVIVCPGLLYHSYVTGFENLAYLCNNTRTHTHTHTHTRTRTHACTRTHTRTHACTHTQETVFEEPLRKLSESEVEEMGLKYYNSDVHRAAFVLPQFAKKVCDVMNAISCA